MNEPHEETHYQIALTNRQVLTAFVALLGCLFLAFFAGVWLGLGERGGDRLAESAVGAETAAEAFEFFGKPKSPAAATSLATSEPTPARQRGAAVRQQTERAAALPPPEDMKQTPKEAERLRPIDRSAANAERAQPNGILVQVFSGTDRGQAEALVDRLKRAGYDRAFLSTIQRGRRELYRIRIGPFRDRQQAQASAAEIESKLGLDTWIP